MSFAVLQRKQYKKARAVVTGRFINGFSKNDYILALIYRYARLQVMYFALAVLYRVELWLHASPCDVTYLYLCGCFYRCRYNKLAIKVAGLQEIQVNGVENIDFSDTVKKHTDYCLNMHELLASVDLLGAADPANVYMDTSDGDGDGEAQISEEDKDDNSLDEVTHG